jgi:two-component system cell cycle sensor histidine kinase/response regulator CckA
VSEVAPAILIVEDEPGIRKLIRIALLPCGFQILEAQNGVEAESLLRSFAGLIRLVVLDIVMPGGNGLDFAVHLQTERPDTAILYISGFSESIAVASIAQKNPASVLVKPFTREQLLSRVQKLLAA